MTLQQLWLLFFQLTDTVWMEHHVWSVRGKHGQYAKDSVIRDPQCAGREVSKAVNTSKEYPSPLDSCQCIKSATVNIQMHTSCESLFWQFSHFEFQFLTLHKKWVPPTSSSISSEWKGICLNFMHVQIYVCGCMGLSHWGWLILTQVDSSLAAVIYFTTHVQGIGEYLNWSPFPCESILLAW